MANVYGTVASGAIFLIIFYCSAFCAAKFDDSHKYEISHHPQGEKLTFIPLRQKRDTPTDLKNQYQSVPQNANDTKSLTPTATSTQAHTTATGETSVVSFNQNDRQLGVNGTGQRKDLTGKLAKTTTLSEVVAPSSADDDKKNAAKFPKKVSGSVAATPPSIVETPEEQVLDSVDVPDDDTIKTIQQNNMTVNETRDYHNYYNSSTIVNETQAKAIWESIKDYPFNAMLSQSHRRAMTVELSFDFPFYGHPVRNITVATGGFLYTGEYVHSWLAATQYIAPLMANFDTNLSNESYVRLKDNGTSFTVIWEHVALQDKRDVGNFTFSVTLHKNGDIVFAYFNVPTPISTIQDDLHPVKVGLSDAYIIDKVVYYARRKTIYEYHRVNFANTDLRNSTIIRLTALPTCLEYTDCVACINHKTSFDCNWCPVMNRCSTGTDRKKQDWLSAGCDHTQITDASICPAIGQRGNNASTIVTPPSGSPNSNNQESTYHPAQPVQPSQPHQPAQPLQPSASPEVPTKSTQSSQTRQPKHAEGSTDSPQAKSLSLENQSEPKHMGMAFGFMVPVCFVMVAMLWVLYAYRNPHTKSGQLLIQYRPSQWGWRRGEARYTAATIHM